MTIEWQQHYAQRTQRIQSSAIRELLKFTAQPDVISFAGGLPAAERFPTAELEAAAGRVLRQRGREALQYAITEGYLPLREWLCQRYADMGVHITPDNVLITTGSAQALYLAGKIFVNPGDPVLVERPTFLGALQAWNSFQAVYVDVPIDEQGLQMAALPPALARNPRFAYILPTFQNPAGTTMPLAHRRQLLALCAERGIPVLEDDPYGQLYYDEPPPPSLLHLALQERDIDHAGVIHTSSFSKILAPGLRLAWVIAPLEVIRYFVKAKQGIDLHTSSFVQQVVYETIKDGFLDQHIPRLRQLYRSRRDAMLQALAETMPSSVSWTHPGGGMFLWLTLPPQLDANALLTAAQEHKVAFVPGSAFFANPHASSNNVLRLNFSNVSEEDIREGITRLAGLIRGQKAVT